MQGGVRVGSWQRTANSWQATRGVCGLSGTNMFILALIAGWHVQAALFSSSYYILYSSARDHSAVVSVIDRCLLFDMVASASDVYLSKEKKKNLPRAKDIHCSWVPVTCDRRSAPRRQPSRLAATRESYLATFQALSVLGRRAFGAAGMTDFHCICQLDVCIHPILYFHAQGSWVHAVAYPDVMAPLSHFAATDGTARAFWYWKNSWRNTRRRAKRHNYTTVPAVIIIECRVCVPALLCQLAPVRPSQ